MLLRNRQQTGGVERGTSGDEAVDLCLSVLFVVMIIVVVRGVGVGDGGVGGWWCVLAPFLAAEGDELCVCVHKRAINGKDETL